MKRPATKRPTNRSGNIRNDLTPEQLASIGAVAILYNEVELFLDIMVGGTLSIDSNELRASLTSRINGTDGKIEIMKAAAANLGAPEPLRVALAEALGLDGFGQLKAYRDVIIHARVLDSSVGIGISAPKRGKFSEILLTTAALDGVYERLELLRLELIFLTESLIPLVVSAEIERPLVGMGQDQTPKAVADKEQRQKSIEREIQSNLIRVRECRTRRQSLPPLPEFPKEPEAQLELAKLGSGPEPQPQ